MLIRVSDQRAVEDSRIARSSTTNTCWDPTTSSTRDPRMPRSVPEEGERHPCPGSETGKSPDHRARTTSAGAYPMLTRDWPVPRIRRPNVGLVTAGTAVAVTCTEELM
ncbi:hypothetical protein PSD17_27330 [Pseudonocardia sp. D17]|nr:hypothetical protein PSD17_27330 [Pseudonocardia sp. D17]